MRATSDLDNAVKAIADALNGIVWADDRQVHELVARRVDDGQLGVLVRVEMMGGMQVE
jgi:Holliday junction resolvase RusA-like endonuclease